MDRVGDMGTSTKLCIIGWGEHPILESQMSEHSHSLYLGSVFQPVDTAKSKKSALESKYTDSRTGYAKLVERRCKLGQWQRRSIADRARQGKSYSRAQGTSEDLFVI